MKKEASVPDIVKHVNSVKVQPGEGNFNSGEMQIPEKLRDVPMYLYELVAESDKKPVIDDAGDKPIK